MYVYVYIIWGKWPHNRFLKMDVYFPMFIQFMKPKIRGNTYLYKHVYITALIEFSVSLLFDKITYLKSKRKWVAVPVTQWLEHLIKLVFASYK